MMPITNLHYNSLEKYRVLLKRTLGLHFTPAKLEMLQAKIDNVMRRNGINSYDLFYELLTKSSNRNYWNDFVDAITVHQSSFFREKKHFEFIRSQLRSILENNRRIIKNSEIKIWSAGCSTGEEPYTIAMVLKEWLPPEIVVRILATDVSGRTLANAQTGSYRLDDIKKEMDPYYLSSYFNRTEKSCEIKPALKELITFRLFNLMDDFSFRDTFDMIFCRNVMIYFDLDDQQNLINKFYEVLTPGGLLFIGHSETLINKRHKFQYVQPAIYLKREKE